MPSNAIGTIVKAWTYASSSNPNKSYETLQYDDGTTSCGCPGWTRRVAEDGSRSCKHTRAVEMGVADSQADAVKDYRTQQRPTPQKAAKRAPKATPIVIEEESPVDVVRKIRW